MAGAMVACCRGATLPELQGAPVQARASGTTVGVPWCHSDWAPGCQCAVATITGDSDGANARWTM